MPEFNSLIFQLKSTMDKITGTEDMVISYFLICYRCYWTHHDKNHLLPIQISTKLDSSQNEVMLAQFSLSILLCSIGFSVYISGIFGMNLDQTSGA